jgi:hypothetical protein
MVALLDGHSLEDRMRTLAWAATAAFSLALAHPASATVFFDSLGGATTGESNTTFSPMAATFATGASATRVDVALLLDIPDPQDIFPGDTYTVSLVGGIPLSDLSFDPVLGLDYLGGAAVDPFGPALASVTLPLSTLPSTFTTLNFKQLAGVTLNPDSLYWIEVSISSFSDAEVDWAITDDVSGIGVAENYLADDATDDGFFLNQGVPPFPGDQAFKMEVVSAPEPATWALMALGFGGLGLVGYRGSRKAIPLVC